MRARRAGSGGGSNGERLRKEAKEAEVNNDPRTAAAKFNEAIADDPRNPWIRLDYARFQAGQGNLPQAYATVNPSASGNSATSILVAAMFDTQQDRWDNALAKINSIPPNLRTQETNNFRDRVLVRGTIQHATRLAASGNRAEARAVLAAIYNDPTVRSGDKRAIPNALYEIGDRDAAVQITRDAAARGGPQASSAQLEYAWMLFRTGHEDDAANVVRQLDANGKVVSEDQEDFTNLKSALTIRNAEQLRIAGNTSAARNLVTPLLADQPNNPGLLSTAGRIAASSGRTEEAMEDFRKSY